MSAWAQSQPEPAYKNPALPIPDRVADLLGRMTLEEKIDQVIPHTTGLLDTTGTFSAAQFRAIMARAFRNQNPYTPVQIAILHNAIQRYQVEKTRLGIPVFFYGEALHGFMAHDATMFPMPIALASTWDPALALRIYTAAAEEARAEGVTQVFAPDLDLGRDPRWGRTEESFGEDPWLVSRMGLAEVLGLQGRHFRIGPEHVLATAKHFTAHGMPEGGTNVGPANISERVLRQNFLFPFKVAVEQGRVGSIMASYNEIDGIPSSVNPWLLTRVLRQEWGFRGYVTSDGSGLEDLVRRHHTAANYAGAARLALAAGVDFDLSSGAVYRTLLAQVRDGRLPMSEINRAVRDILREKFRLGLFDHPYVPEPQAARQIVGSQAHDQLALQAAQESLVLLKNAPVGAGNRPLLPLAAGQYPTIAVIGPDAAAVHLGGYSRGPRHQTSILAGIQHLAAARGIRVLYAKGCEITTDINAQTPPWLAWYKNGIDLPSPSAERRLIAQAVATARRAQLAILVIGENESIDREAWSLQHLGDRDHLKLFGDQRQLVRAVAATGTPVVVVLVNGRPIATDWISAHLPAILEAWYPGQEGGVAVAQALFGVINPSGKLPITIPHTVGDLPDFYDHSPSENIPWIATKCRTGRQPLYPFGYGLSYTTFRFSNLQVRPAVILPGGDAQVSFAVTNTGSRAGAEVAEMYIHERVAVVAQPVLELRGFRRVTLQPGQTRTVTLRLTPEKLAHWDRYLRDAVRPGQYAVKVGGSSDDLLTAVLTVQAGRAAQQAAATANAGSQQP
ncbi:MAG: glycoside hydrolase family 3 N-terminal domain-containing protein [Terriglobales bacterium]